MGMSNIPSLDRTSQSSVEITRQTIEERSFCERHRAHNKCFVRRRKLTFTNTIVLLLQKTVRSIQLHLHDFFDDLGRSSAVASSWCEARLKLKHTAFIELNERAIVEVAYGGQKGFEVRRWKGHRLLAMDSSLLRLPDEPALGERFGWMDFSNPGAAASRCAQGRLSVLSDVLNRLALETLLAPWKTCERELVLNHLPQVQAQDVCLLDRGFASYELWARFIAQDRKFICRCPGSSFSAVNDFFAQNQAGRSREVTLKVPANQRGAILASGLPDQIRVRLVSVRLATGQLEVLATNLMDSALYPAEDLGQAYGHRWGIETYYGLIKSRLDLENFSGRSVEAILQDLYATVFLSNLETILTRRTQEQLESPAQPSQKPAQVNHAVSFHAIKSQMIDLLLGPQPVAEVVQKLEGMFLQNRLYRRPPRTVPRRRRSPWRSYNYQRNLRKAVF